MCLQDVLIHTDEMTDASAHDKQMEDLMRTKVLMQRVEDRKFQCINDSTHSVENSSCQQP